MYIHDEHKLYTKKEFEQIKVNKKHISTEILSAIEYGYRQCEKGKNLQETFENAKG